MSGAREDASEAGGTRRHTRCAAVHARKHLTPITIVNRRETVLNVKVQRVGVHYCANPGGGKSGYVGAVPKNALAAVMVYVRHKPYPVTNSPASFVTLARMPVTGWKVVSEGTGP